MLIINLLGSFLGALPSATDDMYVEDIEIPCGQPVSSQHLYCKVHVQNIPQEYRNIGLRYYLDKVMQNEVSCKVDMFKTDAIATFSHPIGNMCLLALLL